MPDRIPFSIYDWKIPWGYDKRKLVERGLVLMQRFPGFRAEYPHCELKMVSYTKEGVCYEREIVKTPKGEIKALFMPGQTCDVRKQIEYWIKNEEDYEPLIFMIKDTVFKPAYDEIIEAQCDLGEDGLVWVWGGFSPLQEIMLHFTGIEKFCFEMMDKPDLLWRLYDVLWEREQKKFPILAKAPVEMVQYCANHIAIVLGHDLFVNKVLSCLNQCAEVLHTEGKIQSVHVDGDNAIWANDLAKSSIDVIEAFTPAPDTDMTMGEAHETFKDKIIWANFPSSLHLAKAERIRTATKEILQAVAPGDRFILGITEDIPKHCWRTSLNTIMDVIDECGILPS